MRRESAPQATSISWTYRSKLTLLTLQAFADDRVRISGCRAPGIRTSAHRRAYAGAAAIGRATGRYGFTRVALGRSHRRANDADLGRDVALLVSTARDRCERIG